MKNFKFISAIVVYWVIIYTIFSFSGIKDFSTAFFLGTMAGVVSQLLTLL